MKISKEVREFAKLQNPNVDTFVAADEAEAGMAEMSKVYDETGRELYMGAGGGGSGIEGENAEFGRVRGQRRSQI